MRKERVTLHASVLGQHGEGGQRRAEALCRSTAASTIRRLVSACRSAFNCTRPQLNVDSFAPKPMD
jgi:hypothetical protein